MSGTAPATRRRRKPSPPLPVVFITPASVSTLAELAGSLDVPNPDASLMRDCSRFLLLTEEAHEIYRVAGRGYITRVRATQTERDALRATIAATVPRTQNGRHAKAEVALLDLGDTGWFADIARAVLSDFLRGGGGAA